MTEGGRHHFKTANSAQMHKPRYEWIQAIFPEVNSLQHRKLIQNLFPFPSFHDSQQAIVPIFGAIRSLPSFTDGLAAE